jgi:DNA polymerase-4
VRREILRLAQRVGRRLREEGLAAGTVTLKVRTDTLRTFTRSLSLSAPTDLGWEIAEVALGLFRRSEVGARVRLLGISVSRLSPSSPPDLEGRRERRRRAEQVLDELARRFGKAAPVIAALRAQPPSGEGLRGGSGSLPRNPRSAGRIGRAYHGCGGERWEPSGRGAYPSGW